MADISDTERLPASMLEPTTFDADGPVRRVRFVEALEDDDAP